MEEEVKSLNHLKDIEIIISQEQIDKHIVNLVKNTCVLRKALKKLKRF